MNISNLLNDTQIRTLAGLVVAAVLVPLLRKMKARAVAEEQQAKGDAAITLKDHVIEFLADAAAVLAQQKFPNMAADIISGKIKDERTIEVEMSGWGDILRTQALMYFDKQGVDLLQAIGHDALQIMIAGAANKVSPFPGAKTSTVLIANPHLVQSIHNCGVTATRDTFLNTIHSTLPASAGK